MTVHFIGAGPGAPDLITLRGRDLIARCPVCLYAGSLVPKPLLDHCPPHARIVDTAPMSLDEIVAECRRATDAGHDVARLHSGDLSIWSALGEQLRRLEAEGIAYTITPGVPAFAAAAAALGRELTLPEVAQSVVLTRTSGRASSMPERERLGAFAATGATLAIHLSIHALDRVVAELVPHYGAACPVAVVYRASWPEERVVTGTLGTIAAEVAKSPIERTALILVGEVLGASDFRASALYDAAYQRRFRGRGMPDFPPGEVWLAGAGPGDPRLLTMLALHAISVADDIVHDALVDPRTLEHARPDAELIPAGKRGGMPSSRQGDINHVLIERARAGRRVLRLKGGDPFVFGRGWDEAVALGRAGIKFRVIPGVTSGLAAAALAGIPATTRDTNHAVILAAGHRAEDGRAATDWQALARLGQPLILYMPMIQLGEIVAALRQGGMAADTPAALIQSATTESERVVESRLGTLVEDAAREKIASPAIVVIGAVAALRRELEASLVGWR